jgi:signal recognition particle subunit SRP54
MPEHLVPKGGDADATARLKKFMVIMDSMNKAELDGKVNLHDDTDQVQSRILRIARGSGSHPNEVKLLLLNHKQFEGMVSKMGKSMGAAGGNASAGSKLKQQQLAAQMRKNPLLIQQRINQMDPRILQQMGGRENVMAM